ncbi:MAG: tetratricopeptide repeat protein [Candidatus Marinimicrobia bacterium]|nr:tetratricopeptide repeat protein [Candidatus Neomarinimicrobiota bacterium]
MKPIHKIGILLTIAVIFVSCGTKETADELWTQIRTLQGQEKHDEVLLTLKKFLDNYPEDENAADGRFMLADGYANVKKDFTNAVLEYRRVILENPDSPLAPKAQFMIGYIYANYVKEYDKARAAYLEFQEKYEDNSLSQAVAFELENLGKNLDEISTLKGITNPDGI